MINDDDIYLLICVIDITHEVRLSELYKCFIFNLKGRKD